MNQESWAEREERTRREYKEALFNGLKAYPEITQLVVPYDGEGDSGSIYSDDVKLLTVSGEPFHVPNMDNEQFRCMVEPLQEAAAEWCYYILPGGWEINEGSFGKVFIDVATQTAKIEHHERYYETNDSEFEVD